MAEITGNDIFEVARDKLTGLVSALITTQASNGDDPAVGYMYDNHAPAKLQLNGCSVALEAASPAEERGHSTGRNTSVWIMEFTVRVHTSYLPHGIRDDQKVARLLNSLVNKFETNRRPGDDLDINYVHDVMVGEEFEESVSYGGQLTVDVVLPVLQTQE